MALEALLQADDKDEHPLAPGFEILQQRSERQKPIIAELKQLEQAGKLSVSLDELARSYIHMFLNRLLRSAQREQELVLYDVLTKLYESKIARTL